MSKKSKWRDPEQQDMMWKDGSYDYLSRSIVNIKFWMSAYFINRECRDEISVLDVGAGTGELLSLIADKLGTYFYNDISRIATKAFKERYKEIGKAKEVIAMNCTADEALRHTYKSLDVILILGANEGLYEVELLDNALDKLNPGGILILDCNDVEEKYFSFPAIKPKYRIEYHMKEPSYKFSAHNRVIRVFKKEEKEIDPVISPILTDEEREKWCPNCARVLFKVNPNLVEGYIPLEKCPVPKGGKCSDCQHWENRQQCWEEWEANKEND